MTRSRVLCRTSQALLVLGSLVAFAVPSAAQYAAQTVALSGGPLMPRASLSDSLKSGYHLTAGLGFHFGDHLTLRLEGMYEQFARKAVTSPSNLHMFGFTGNLEIIPLGLSGPYLVGGWGYYQTAKSGTVPASKFEPGINYGAGWRLFTKRFSVFGEARIHQVQGGSGKPASMPIALGIRV